MNFFRTHNVLILVLLTTITAYSQQVDFLKLVSNNTVYVSESSSVVKLTFEINQGLHIQSNDPEDDSVVPTEISINWPQGIGAYDPIFPPAKEMVLEGSNQLLQVFNGAMEVAVALNFDDDIVKGLYQIPGQIRYQACDNKRCFYPRELTFSFDLLVE